MTQKIGSYCFYAYCLEEEVYTFREDVEQMNSGEKKIQKHEIDQWRRATLGKQWEMRTMWEIPGRTPSFEISDPKKKHASVYTNL